jgi:hypothetical protein
MPACNVLWILVLCAGGMVTLASPALAQRQWEIEFHGGSGWHGGSAGTPNLPGPGETFTTAGIYPPPAPQVVVVSTSRRIPSWYFGDGALLFNQAAAAVAANPVAMTAAFPGRIVALDPALTRPLAEARAAGALGVRLTRAVSARLGVELSIDYSPARVRITKENSDAIEATRASFIAAFSGLITSNPNRMLNSLTSIATVKNAAGGELLTTGALIVNLKASGNVIPYATAGAGMLATSGTMPAVTLTGNYQFRNPSGSPIDETDRVALTVARDRRTLSGIVGAGIKYYATRRWGARLDARVSLSRNTTVTRLDATPTVSLGLTPAGRGTLNAEPTVQFSNNWTDPVTALGVTAVARSSLSGDALSGFRTWSGTGVSRHTIATAGVFWRF